MVATRSPLELMRRAHALGQRLGQPTTILEHRSMTPAARRAFGNSAADR